MAIEYVPFEKPIIELEQKIDELKRVAANQVVNLDDKIADLEDKKEKIKLELFSNLSPYDTVQLARHPKRPTTLDIINALCLDFIELKGDRRFRDDPAVVGGIGTIDGISCVLIGHQKGKDTKENIMRSFGMPRPEGYRKALRLMKLAESFELPLITFVDTPGAYPGIDAEERGQSEAIASNILEMAFLKTKTISIITGEGGSGGALALAASSKVHMLSYAIYSVISPEGCASILLKDSSKSDLAAEYLKLTAKYNLELGIIDSIIEEPIGGAHRNFEAVVKNIKDTILKDLSELDGKTMDELKEERIKKILNIGSVKQTNISFTEGFDKF